MPVIKKSNISDFNATDRVDVGLLDNHVHFLVGEITEENVSNAIKWITFENLHKKAKILTLYINSSGGDLYQAFALIDVMNNSNYPIRTIGIGSIMSAAFLIFASGEKGERLIAPNTGIMCHQFSGATADKYHDIKASMVESDYCNKRMLDILMKATGKTSATIQKRLLPPTDVYLTAREMIALKAADKLYIKPQ